MLPLNDYGRLVEVIDSGLTNPHELASLLQDMSQLDLQTITSLLSAIIAKRSNSVASSRLATTSKSKSPESYYTNEYYKKQQEVSRRSADVIVPLLLEFLDPRSVVDVGCGTGSWLSIFMKHGIADVLGVDGDWVDKEMLHITEDRFLSFNLEKPLVVNRKFDLAISLEVAEHLPAECADQFVNSLCELSQVVCFSAAIPFQEGVSHVNEQWPNYWVELFRKRGYRVIDCIRERIWENDNVSLAYAQNMLIFSSWDYLERNILLKQEYQKTNIANLARVHPKFFLKEVFWRQVVDPAYRTGQSSGLTRAKDQGQQTGDSNEQMNSLSTERHALLALRLRNKR